ncbi:MAG TPA: mechanosensitive ion channel domain-containing protein [Myxococcota bacterium]|nr:mechanosensitive ion channel domain-containing protein [Myxococcota bacterium]
MRHALSSFLLEHFPILKEEVFGYPAWYWVSVFVALVVSIVIARMLIRPLTNLVAFLSRQRELGDKRLFIEKLHGPIQVFATLMIFLLLSIFIKEPEHNEHDLSTAIRLVLILAFTYLFYKLIDYVFTRMLRFNQSPRSRVALVLPLGRRIAKTVLVILAFLLLLSQFGVDVSAFLVGLGVGGVAIALASQKILENLFGGAVLSLDQPFQVGDYCKCGDLLGYVEEIGVRSTRIRTLDRTLITIPNSKLSEMNIENYMEREKIRLYTILRISLDTPMDKLKELLSEFERLLLTDDNFHHDFHRIRLIGINDTGFDIEIYAFARSTVWSEFVAMREGLFFAYLAKMDELEIKLALPSVNNFIHTNADGLSKQPL